MLWTKAWCLCLAAFAAFRARRYMFGMTFTAWDDVTAGGGRAEILQYSVEVIVAYREIITTSIIDKIWINLLAIRVAGKTSLLVTDNSLVPVVRGREADVFYSCWSLPALILFHVRQVDTPSLLQSQGVAMVAIACGAGAHRQG